MSKLAYFLKEFGQFQPIFHVEGDQPQKPLLESKKTGEVQQPIVFVWSHDGHSEHAVPEAT